MIGLEYVRKLNGDTTVTLAEKIKVVNSLVSQWENGKKKIPKSRVDQIASLYNVSADLLLMETTAFDRVVLESESKPDDVLVRKKLEIERILAKVADELINMEGLNDFRITATSFVTVNGKNMSRVRTYKSNMSEGKNDTQ